MRFLDLFAGLGGFHLALRELGHECVFASEVDNDLRKVYKNNFGLMPTGDIRNVDIGDIPPHEILCAGFPCQPFSKAGEQGGFDCPNWGDLFEYVVQVLRSHRPPFFILENVPNILKHDEGKTWQELKRLLENPSWGYSVDSVRLSPHQFGIPQIRDRVFIVGSRIGLKHFVWPMPTDEEPDLTRILDKNPEGARQLPQHYVECLEVWQEFIGKYPKNRLLPSFPIWSMEFNATYPYKQTTPFAMTPDRLQRWRGCHGRKLKDLSDEAVMDLLPSHATRPQAKFPSWKVRFISQNRQLAKDLKPWLDEWIPQILPFASSLQKLEWNYKGGERDIWKHVIQFRASGIRIKRPTTAPSLVAMTTTQIPIIGWEKRYMTRRECARLQSMDSLKYLPQSDSKVFSALGNAVNVEMVERIARSLLKPLAIAVPDGAHGVFATPEAIAACVS